MAFSLWNKKVRDISYEPGKEETLRKAQAIDKFPNSWPLAGASLWFKSNSQKRKWITSQVLPAVTNDFLFHFIWERENEIAFLLFIFKYFFFLVIIS